MEPQDLLAQSVPPNCDLYVGLITSDFQVRVRWGFMGFENQWWDEICLPELLRGDGWHPARVDVNHRNILGDGYMVGIKSGTALDYPRLQADWTTPRPMDWVIAAFALPWGSYTQDFAVKSFRQHKRIGISIEHGGRKPKRTIGPFVTICNNPWNLDCWMIYDQNKRFIYPLVLKLKGGNRIPICPASVQAAAADLLDRVKSLPIK